MTYDNAMRKAIALWCDPVFQALLLLPYAILKHLVFLYVTKLSLLLTQTSCEMKSSQ